MRVGKRHILISGAGIAGCCLAWWLERDGNVVTVVERSDEPRRGGYVIDFWGLGYDVAERMGLLPELRQHDLAVVEFRVLDGDGRRVSGIDQGAIQKMTGGRVMSLQRSVLAHALFESIKERVDVRFGESIARIEQRSDGVDVGFDKGEGQEFDLVIGADGLHSNVRRRCFGETAGQERFLGYYVAAFSAPGYRHRDLGAYVAYGLPGRQIWRITLNEDAAVFLLVFPSTDPSAIPLHDPNVQKKELANLFGGTYREADEMLRALESATDLYLDRVSQIVMPQWSNERVALVGDACACPSLLAGEGSAMAMAEAYTLAGELAASPDDHTHAFNAYQERLQAYTRRKQQGARGFARSFVPRTRFGLFARNLTLNIVNALGLGGLVFAAQLRDVVRLPDYGPAVAGRADS